MVMMRLIGFFLFLIASFCVFCVSETDTDTTQIKVRLMTDTVGYAHSASRMDSIVQRIERRFGRERENLFFIQNINAQDNWHLVICPHDDYSYAGEIYTFALKNLRTPLIIVFGVAHQAKRWNLENRLIFDSFQYWNGPYTQTAISTLREEIMAELSPEYYMAHDSLHQVEHSVEALLPFLQYYNRQVEIIPILVPYMRFEEMEQISLSLAKVIQGVGQRKGLIWGKDYALAISNDCVHYGDQDWGGKNNALFGADTTGYHTATNHDMNIISECLIDQLEPQGIRRFFEYTVNINNYKEYSWTWCGRYSVPLGLLTAYHLQSLTSTGILDGKMLRYSTSISRSPITVDDIGMAVTAPANIHHWVGYVAIGYRPF